MPTNITGSYYGGRRPLTYNLMPGQFRNSRVSIFPSQTIINNNIGFGGCYDYGNYDCCGGSNKMNWFDWTMMGGMLLTGLGNLFACFWGGGGSESPAEEEKPLDLTTIKSDVKVYQNAYKNICTSAEVLSDGQILASISDKVETYENLDKFKDALERASIETPTDAGAATRTDTSTVTDASASASVRDDGLSSSWNGVSFKGENQLMITSLSDSIVSNKENIDFSGATIKYSEDMGKNVKVPRTITITIEGGIEYKFELCDNKLDNIDCNPKYKCVKQKGEDLNKDGYQHEYMLTSDGKFVQNTSTRGFGYALGEDYNEYTDNVDKTLYDTPKYNSSQHSSYSIRENMSADEVLQACLGDKYKELSDTEKKKLQAQLCQLNPNGMQGAVVRNLNRLTLILSKTNNK